MGALKNKTTRSQCRKLLKYLREHKEGVSATDAWEALGIERVSARVFDLRQCGHEIRNDWYQYKNEDGNTVRFCKYVLVKEAV